MYSFEGKFKTTPTVSLGGKRKNDKLDKERLLLKAQKERQKREEIRRRLCSALVIQSSVRSFLVRQHLKKHRRQQFDEKRQKLKGTIGNVDQLYYFSKCLKFFYKAKEDDERLAWLGQHVLRHKEDWIAKDDRNLFAALGILKLCFRCLSVIDPSSSIAIPLRMVETLTLENLIKTGLQLDDDGLQLCMLEFWNKLISNGYFSCILHLFSTRVPPDIELSQAEGSVPPPTPLAGTLLSLLVRPITGIVQDNFPALSEDSMEVEPRPQLLKNQVFSVFVKEVLCEQPTTQLYHYVYPALGQLPDFPISCVVETAKVAMNDPRSKHPGLFAALVKLVHPKLESLPERTFSTYLYCVQCLVVQLPKARRLEKASFDGDSDEEMVEDMDVLFHQTEGTSVPLSNLASDCRSTLASQLFIDACVGRKIHEHQTSTSLDSICAICYHLIAIGRVTIQKNKLLYTLAFSTLFLRKLWHSTMEMSTASKVTGKSIPLVQLLLEGSPMAEEETALIRSKLVVFCTLFNLNLLSVHDKDFYTVRESTQTQSESTHMAFSTLELVSISLIMRDVCIGLIKKALPETRLKLGGFNAKNMLHALSFGRAVEFGKIRGNKEEAEREIKDTNDTVFLFTVCRRLVKHLHTRDARHSFIPKGSWLSNSIIVKTDQSNDFASRWHRRTENNSAVAAHLANTSDEDIILSVTEARQLAVLMNMPFVISFQTRVSIFMTMLQKDRNSRESERQRLLGEAGFGDRHTTNEITVRREYLYEDAFNDLSPENAPDLRKRLRVMFVNSAGLNEAGYGAGVTREFLQQIVKAGFNPSRGFFRTTAQGRLCPNPHATAIVPNANDHFYFLGRMLGKVIYEGMQVELPFASFFLCKILQRKNTDVDINHLQSLDPDFYKNLMYLHDYDGDISDLDLNFTVVDETLGVTTVTELMPGGKNMTLTNANKVLYMHLVANYKLNVQMRGPCLHFRRGLEDVVNVDWLQMFDHEEFQTLVAGAEIPIDIEDLKVHAAYSGGYTVEHPTIGMFWQVLPMLTNSQLSQLLLFVTSCSRPPLLGFKELNPPFCIQRGGTEDRLPSASTCLNLLKLPEYSDPETLKTKLLYCLGSQSGFELS